MSEPERWTSDDGKTRWSLTDEQAREMLYEVGFGGERRLWRWEGRSGKTTSWHLAPDPLKLALRTLPLSLSGKPVEAWEPVVMLHEETVEVSGGYTVACGLTPTVPEAGVEQTRIPPPFEGLVETDMADLARRFEDPAEMDKPIPMESIKVCAACVHELKRLMLDEFKALCKDGYGPDAYALATSHPEALRSFLGATGNRGWPKS